MIEVPKFKIRASAAHSIMGGTIGASESQLKNIAKMEAKATMTDLQREKYDKDIFARDNPTLPAGAKTYVKKWLKEQKDIYNRRKEINSKYLEKGLATEDWCIGFLNAKLLTNYKKNAERKEDEWFTGECDIDAEPEDKIKDIKSSWDTDTFPLFKKSIPDEKYKTQINIYMHLWGRKKGSVDYVLMDAPDHLIEKEAKSLAYKKNIDIDDARAAMYKHMTYGDVDDRFRHKCFKFGFDQSIIDELKVRVEMCREYVKELIEGVG